MAEYKAVNWSPTELLGQSKTEQLGDNAEWLFNNTPRAIYTLPGGLRRAEGIKLAAGRVLITKRKSDSATVTVRFADFFSSGCQPIVTTGIIAEGQTRIFCTVNGIGILQPDNRGFQASVNVAAETKKNDSIARSLYISWQAMGY